MRKVIPHNLGVGSHGQNDCIVQALTNALEKPYVDMLASARAYGYSSDGISVRNTYRLLTVHGFSCRNYGASLTSKALNCFVLSDDWHAQGTTIGAWLKTDAAQEGRYIVNVRGHVFSVVNGTVYDSFASSIHKRICAVYKLNQG